MKEAAKGGGPLFQFSQPYLSWVQTLVKVVFSEVPYGVAAKVSKDNTRAWTIQAVCATPSCSIFEIRQMSVYLLTLRKNGEHL